MAEVAQDRDEVVSFDAEQLVVVDSDDQVLGHDSKSACHDGQGILHRAFSLFVFNARGEILLQQRGRDKRLWPGYWANSCCSHPRRGEVMDTAIGRRLHEEMGMRCELQYVYKFQYQAHYGDLGSEYELCWVYVGRSNDPVDANATEVADWCFMTPEALDQAMQARPEQFTPWLHMEWHRLRTDFAELLPTAEAARSD